MVNNLEWLYLQTVDDLASKLQERTRYSLIMCSVNVRKLIADGGSANLATQANQKHRLKLRFETHETDTLDLPERLQPPILMLNPDLSLTPNAKGRPYTLDQFLAFGAMRCNGTKISILQIIKYCAFVHGGVHAGDVTSEEHRLVEEAEKHPAFKDHPIQPPTLIVIEGAAAVMLRGLAQLTKLVREEYARATDSAR